MQDEHSQRSISLFGATFVGIGAIVGGGIFVLGGVAFREAGSAAILAFALNGLLAFITVLSFAELATLFPESGGAYTYAKKILSVRAAFSMGWILWFAHIVTALLYALGFAAYAKEGVSGILLHFNGSAPNWIQTQQFGLFLAVAAIAFYTRALIIQVGAGGNTANYIKLLIFAVLIFGGLNATIEREAFLGVSEKFSPILPFGAIGLFSAMGFTFIALQGFDLICAIAGEVKSPQRTIPRAMIASLLVGLLVYIPILILVVLVGVPEGEDLRQWCGAKPEVCFAEAAYNYMGSLGYWLVIVAAVSSTLSALSANLLAASRVALTMARDRTLPRALAQVHQEYDTPLVAILANATALLVLMLVVSDAAVAGAAASLVFLITFAFCHVTSFFARSRVTDGRDAFRAPFFPLIPILGATACILLALFQAVQVPAAGVVLVLWLGLGVFFYFASFASRAEALDAYREMSNPELLGFRGTVPLVLVPISNPSSAPGLVSVGHALASPEYGKVLLLKVVQKVTADKEKFYGSEIQSANQVLYQALITSLTSVAREPEALLTVSDDPWSEIVRVSRSRRCQTVLLGFSNLREKFDKSRLETLMNEVDGDTVLLSAPDGWRLHDVRKVLLPVGGSTAFDSLRARIVGALIRMGAEQICYLSLQSPNASKSDIESTRAALAKRAQDEASGFAVTEIKVSENIAETIIESAQGSDMIISGLNRMSDGKLHFGPISEMVARQAPCPTMIIGRARRR